MLSVIGSANGTHVKETEDLDEGTFIIEIGSDNEEHIVPYPRGAARGVGGLVERWVRY